MAMWVLEERGQVSHLWIIGWGWTQSWKVSVESYSSKQGTWLGATDFVSSAESFFHVRCIIPCVPLMFSFSANQKLVSKQSIPYLRVSPKQVSQVLKTYATKAQRKDKLISLGFMSDPQDGLLDLSLQNHLLSAKYPQHHIVVWQCVKQTDIFTTSELG